MFSFVFTVGIVDVVDVVVNTMVCVALRLRRLLSCVDTVGVVVEVAVDDVLCRR